MIEVKQLNVNVFKVWSKFDETNCVFNNNNN